MTAILEVALRRVAAGLWRTDDLAADAPELFRDLDWRVIDLDLASLSSKDEVLAALGKAGDFPEHYGHNWDAAYDCLTDLEPDVVCVRSAAGLDAAVSKTLLSIAEDAVAYWQQHNHHAYVLWDGPIDRPSLS